MQQITDNVLYTIKLIKTIFNTAFRRTIEVQNANHTGEKVLQVDLEVFVSVTKDETSSDDRTKSITYNCEFAN